MKRESGQMALIFGIIFVLVGCASTTKVQYQTSLPAMIKQPQTSFPEKIEKIPKQVTEESDQPKVSNLWEEADLRAVLHDIVAQTGTNIICDETVEGTVSLEIKDTPLEKALKMVLEPGGYVFKRIDEKHYLVGLGTPGSPMALTLSQTESIITNRLAEEVVSLLSPDLTPFVRAAKGGYSLSITAPPEIIERIREDIAVIDTSQPLIIIEVLVTEVKRSKGSSGGIDWSQILELQSSGGLELKRGTEWAYSGILKGNLATSVQMLSEQGKLEIKATPKLVTRNGEEGEIDVSREKYVLLYEGGPKYAEGPYYYYYPRFEAKPIKSGVVLKVKPRISREGKIILDLNAEVSDMESTNSAELPVVEKRGTKTTVEVKPGETIVIGGLYQEISREVKRGVPVLGRIPLLNFLFQKKEMERENTELVIFVTPKILPE